MYDDPYIDDSEYPDERDIDDFGDDSPADYDPLTVGYIGDGQAPVWTAWRIIGVLIVLVMIAAFVLPSLLSVF